METKSKMADSRFALSDEMPKTKNTTESTQTSLNVWQKWASERKVNTKLEQYEHGDLDKMLEMFYAEVRTKDGLEYA